MKFLTRLLFQTGDPLAKIPADWFRTVSRRLDHIRLVNGTVDITSDSITLTPDTTGGGTGGIDFNWNVQGIGLAITVTPGAIELGPDTVIEWGDMIGHTDTITLVTGTTLWWVWVNIDVENEAATMYNGASISALDSTEKKTILQKRIAKITLASDTVTKIERAQCGNIFIPRL